MEIQNLETKVKYRMPRTSWEKLGKNQKLFKVLDETDEEEAKPQIIDNTVKPRTGDAVIIKGDDKKTNTKQTKK